MMGEVKAGALVLIHGNLLHKSERNACETNIPRSRIVRLPLQIQRQGHRCSYKFYVYKDMFVNSGTGTTYETRPELGNFNCSDRNKRHRNDPLRPIAVHLAFKYCGVQLLAVRT